MSCRSWLRQRRFGLLLLLALGGMGVARRGAVDALRGSAGFTARGGEALFTPFGQLKRVDVIVLKPALGGALGVHVQSISQKNLQAVLSLVAGTRGADHLQNNSLAEQATGSLVGSETAVAAPDLRPSPPFLGSIFHDPELLRGEILALPWVKEVRVRRKFFNRLSLTLEPRQAVAWVLLPRGRLRLCDESGALWAPELTAGLQLPEEGDFPVLAHFWVESPATPNACSAIRAEGGQFCVPESHVRAFQAALRLVTVWERAAFVASPMLIAAHGQGIGDVEGVRQSLPLELAMIEPGASSWAELPFHRGSHGSAMRTPYGVSQATGSAREIAPPGVLQVSATDLRTHRAVRLKLEGWNDEGGGDAAGSFAEREGEKNRERERQKFDDYFSSTAARLARVFRYLTENSIEAQHVWVDSGRRVIVKRESR